MENLSSLSIREYCKEREGFSCSEFICGCIVLGNSWPSCFYGRIFGAFSACLDLPPSTYLRSQTSRTLSRVVHGFDGSQVNLPNLEPLHYRERLREREKERKKERERERELKSVTDSVRLRSQWGQVVCSTIDTGGLILFVTVRICHLRSPWKEEWIDGWKSWALGSENCACVRMCVCVCVIER